MLYYVRKATTKDLNDILEVIQNGRETLNKAGIPQWQNNEGPNEISLGKDLSLEEGYVLIEESRIIGYGTITKEEQVGYDDITEGEWLPSEKYASLHRVAIHSDVKEKGKGQFFLSHLISGSIALGYKDIRIDTHPSNLRMQKVIEKAGFSYQGTIVLPVTDGKRKAYQIIID
ncbi:GNAT family N-acetyltransferase [Vagococcus fluvialis]|uniref:GNAT family N-acetyltransferase n=1 Tax=Vagococcus fluvialis TaxID=2738 RepID=UPI003B591993